MHELGILYHVVARVEKAMAANQVTEVEAIVLQVGELSGVIPKYLHACFPAAVDGTALEHTRLEIENLSANARCPACGKVFGAIKHQRICPFCGQVDCEVISGREFLLKEIRAR